MVEVLEVGERNDIVGWLAFRMLKRSVQDAIVTTFGDRGVGKSYMNMYLAEKLAERLALLTGQPTSDFFSVDNIRSVDPEGTMAMFSSEQLTVKKNQIFIVDDAGITANARNFQTAVNKRLNAILTTARIYRHCIIMNTVSSEHLDSVVRGYADIGLHVRGVLPGTTVNQVQVYRMGHSTPMGTNKRGRTQIGKYFRLTLEDGERHRMKMWYTTQPSQELRDKYDDIRKNSTNAFVLNAFSEENVPVIRGPGRPPKPKTPEDPNAPPKPHTPNRYERKRKAVYDKHFDTVHDLQKQGMSVNAMYKKTGVYHSMILKMLATDRDGWKDVD